jgi:hypothetical protein
MKRDTPEAVMIELPPLSRSGASRCVAVRHGRQG